MDVGGWMGRWIPESWCQYEFARLLCPGGTEKALVAA